MPKKSMVLTPRTEMVQSTTFRRFKLLSEDIQNVKKLEFVQKLWK